MVKRSTQPRLTLLILLFYIGVSAVSTAAEHDPLEPVNRVVFSVNDGLDRWLLKPTAKVYQAVMPEFAERGVRNFFSNLGEVRNVVHNTLQGKLDRSAQSLGRFAINSTVGVGGLFDVASKIGIQAQPEDLGQTLGVWGLDAGPYLVLPILGPSTLRDSSGVFVDPLLSPLTYAPLEAPQRLGFAVTDGVQTRADLLSAESLLMGDAYTLYREAYLSKRTFDIQDGQITSDDFLDDDTYDGAEGDFLDEAF